MELLAENRKARFDYEILESYEAGIVLKGFEVKSVKARHMNLTGSYAVLRAGEAWLLNAQIPPYQPKNAPEDYEPARSRRLLLKKTEIKELLGRLQEKGLALVPIKAVAKHGIVKIELGLARSRKKHDKRELLKKRTVEREIQRGE